MKLNAIFNLMLSVVMASVLLSSFDACAKNNKKENQEETITAKVWFKDGRIYEGPLVKHWRTYGQTFLAPGHNFHILSEDGKGKTVKCEAKNTDSILITESSHPDFKAGDFYVSFNGKTNVLGGRTMHKLLKREQSGRNVDFCKLTYIDNCISAGANMDQWMEYWIVWFRASGRAAVFFETPLSNGCHGPCCNWGTYEIKKHNEALADAINEKFCADKEMRRKYILQIQENPMLYVDFIDNYLSEVH